MEEPPTKKSPSPAASFTDDIIAEILRRLPVRSVCRFKCVSRSWRKLISDPVHRKNLPQTLEGFFYHSYNCERFPARAHHFTNVTGKGLPFIYPSLSFLPVPSREKLSDGKLPEFRKKFRSLFSVLNLKNSKKL